MPTLHVAGTPPFALTIARPVRILSAGNHHPVLCEVASVCTPVCTSDEERAMEALIVEAELAGRRTVADALARRLEELRAKVADVVDLSAYRPPRSR
jgi:hypothetical protein